MNDTRYIIGRWVAAALVMLGLLGAIYNVVVDNLPKGEVRVIEDYVAWSDETLDIAEVLPAAMSDSSRDWAIAANTWFRSRDTTSPTVMVRFVRSARAASLGR